MDPGEKGKHGQEEQEVVPEEVIVELFGEVISILVSLRMLGNVPVAGEVKQQGDQLWVAHEEGTVPHYPPAPWAVGIEPNRSWPSSSSPPSSSSAHTHVDIQRGFQYTSAHSLSLS